MLSQRSHSIHVRAGFYENMPLAEDPTKQWIYFVTLCASYKAKVS